MRGIYDSTIDLTIPVTVLRFMRKISIGYTDRSITDSTSKNKFTDFDN